MRKLHLTVSVLIIVGFLFSNVQAGEDISQVLFENYKGCTPVPLPSSAIPGLTVNQAYEIQNRLVSKFIKDGAVVAGYKAGLTSPPAQKKFKAPGPVTGVLLEDMRIANGKVSSKPYTKLMLEVEIGYILNQDIKTPTTPQNVKNMVGAILPAVEVPDLNFATFKGLAFTDIIADNVGARGYLLGKERPIDKVEPNTVTGQLFMNEKAMGPAVPARAALGDQWKALSWALNNVLANGYEIKKGMVVITGSLGKMYPGKPGSYKAVYTGGLDNLEFTVQ